MKSPMKIPTQVPEKGFYYHYKHDPSGSVNNYAYEFLGVGFHTEEDGVYFANYRPLYEDAGVYQASLKLGVQCTDERPLAMWMSDVIVDGMTKKRFTKITDGKILTALCDIRDRMYP
jgi:hypothetical protein